MFDTGTKISAVAHIGLVGWVMIEGVFSGFTPPSEPIQEVSIITMDEFEALTAFRTPPALSQEVALPAPATPNAPDLPEVTDDLPVPQIDQPDPVAKPQPETEPEPPTPEPVPDLPDTAVLAPPAPDTPVTPDLPQISDETPALQQSDRVAPTPVAPPPEDVAIDVDSQSAVTPDETGEVEAESQRETAEEAASDRIVTEAEAEEVASAVPFRGPPLRPRDLQVPQPTPTPTPTPAAQPQTDPNAAAEDALRQALGTDPVPVPTGPPLTAGEKDGLRVAVSRCWNTGSLSTDALQVTVEVGVTMNSDGTPDVNSIRQLSATGGSGRAVETAFQAARRAIIRCGARGFELPVEKYDQWREIEMTFNPERMRIK